MPEEAYGRTDQGRDVERFAELAQRIEIGEGRRLTSTEIQRLADLDEQAELRGEDSIDPSQALHDLDSSDGIAAYIGERLEAPREKTEPSANVLDPDTGEERPGFNLDNSAELAAHIDARMAGEDVAAYDDTFESGDE